MRFLLQVALTLWAAYIVQAAERPNIVLVMCDDLGWGDVGFNGGEDIQTPHLDAMAKASLRFERFYAAAPVCSPTRGSCITGRHPFRYGIYFANTGHMKPEELTLAELLKKHGYTTEVMGASFRNIDEIIELAGCDLLTISPKLLDQLRKQEGTLVRKLDGSNPSSELDKLSIDAQRFEQMMAEDRMAHEKLAEGIQGFTKAIETLEAQLAHRLAVLEGGAAFAHAAQEIFLLNDLDGDGCICREEWLGSDAVFDALDGDHDGKLYPEDVRAGLGAALAAVR